MHSTRIRGTVFQHNGDLSGDLIIIQEQEDSCIGHNKVRIPVKDLMEFIIDNSEEIKRWRQDSINLSWQGGDDMGR